MEEILRCRMKNWDTAAPVGECVLERKGQRLRARLQLSGITGLAEWYLFSAKGEAVCAHAEPVQGVFVCDRGMAWLSAMPSATVVLSDGKTVAFSGDRGWVTQEKLQALLRSRMPASIREPLAEKAAETKIPETRQEDVQEDVPEDSAQAEEPVQIEEPAEESLPRQAAEILPWALDAQSIDLALEAGDTIFPFPGMLEGAKFVRLPLGDVAGADHYVAGKIPLMESAAYYLVGIPAPPEGMAQMAAQDFTHYLPSREGAGYWVKYIRG